MSNDPDTTETPETETADAPDPKPKSIIGGNEFPITPVTVGDDRVPAQEPDPVPEEPATGADVRDGNNGSDGVLAEPDEADDIEPQASSSYGDLTPVIDENVGETIFDAESEAGNNLFLRVTQDKRGRGLWFFMNDGHAFTPGALIEWGSGFALWTAIESAGIVDGAIDRRASSPEPKAVQKAPPKLKKKPAASQKPKAKKPVPSKATKPAPKKAGKR